MSPAAGGGGVECVVDRAASGHAQRAERYLAATTTHPARMLPEIAAHAIAALTEPGELVLDPLCGTGTTLVEALHLRRAAVGIDIDPHWASLARDNIAHTQRTGVDGYAHVLTGDARGLPTSCRPSTSSRSPAKSSLCSPPGRTPHCPTPTPAPAPEPVLSARAPGGVGMVRILRGCLPLLAPGGYVVITARRWREHGELVDLPTTITHTAVHAGLTPVPALCGRCWLGSVTRAGHPGVSAAAGDGRPRPRGRDTAGTCPATKTCSCCGSAAGAPAVRLARRPRALPTASEPRSPPPTRPARARLTSP